MRFFTLYRSCAFLLIACALLALAGCSQSEPMMSSSDANAENRTMPSIVGGMDALRAAVEEPSEGINRGEIREVEFRFIIEADGSFTNPQLVQSSSVPSVDRAVLNGLRSVEWEPGTENGEPVRMQITMPIEIQRGEWDW
jgi:TonB family protein